MDSVNKVGTVTQEAGGDEAASSPRRRRFRIPRPRFLPPVELPSDKRTPRWVPLVVVGIAVGFNLWVLRYEILPVRQLNDSSVHQSMVHWALDRIQGGHITLDGWYPYLNLGSSLFHHYQSLPHTLTAYLSLLIGQDWSFSIVLYVLLATWPVSVYLGARLLGWERWAAAGAALVAPLIVSTPGYGYEHGSYTWRGLGVWSQLWAMWLLPLAWGFGWRAVSGKAKTLAIGALFVGLTAACHFITGYMALLVLGVWVLIKPSEFFRRLGRAAVVGVGGLLIISWVVVPLLLDSKYSTVSRYLVGTFWFDSFGAKKVFGWLFSGQLFDGVVPTRLPVISVLVAIGAVVCLARFRTDERARGLLGAFALFLIIFSGRAPFAPLVDLLPGSGDLLLHRFISGVQMAGILLAGVGVGWIVGLVKRLVASVERAPARAGAIVAAAAVGLLLLAPAWTERAAFDATGAGWLQTQRSVDGQEGANVDALVAEAKALGPGRIYAGSSGTTNPDRIYSVPLYEYLPVDDADGVGFYFRTTSLSSDLEALFDASDPAQYDLFNVRYVILPVPQQPLVPAKLVSTKGTHSLYTVETTGYLKVVDALPPITADRTNLAEQVESWMGSTLPAEGRFPTIAFAGDPGAPPTLPTTSVPDGPAGTVTSQTASITDGVFSGQVDLVRPGMVMLKASFDPRWTVQVDGVQLPTQMVAPSFVGREVAAGRHSVVFTYHPFPRYDLLLAVGALVFMALLILPRWWDRRRAGRSQEASG